MQLSNFNSQKVTPTSGFLNDAGVIRRLVSLSVNALRLYLNLVSNAGNVDVGVLVATRGEARCQIWQHADISMGCYFAVEHDAD